MCLLSAIAGGFVVGILVLIETYFENLDLEDEDE